MNSSAATVPACRWGAHAAICTLFGIVVSGPLAVLVLSVVRPQPAWSDAETFARHYHWLQALPYFGGFFLVVGFVTMMGNVRGAVRILCIFVMSGFLLVALKTMMMAARERTRSIAVIKTL